MEAVKRATGCTVKSEWFEKYIKEYDITEYGAGTDETPERNTEAINRAIAAASVCGGKVVVPAGEYKTYTIRLKSNLIFFLEDGAVIRAAQSLMVGRGDESPAAENSDVADNNTEDNNALWRNGTDDNWEGSNATGIRNADCIGHNNYDEPEINIYAGLQDHGHTYFANSLVYGENLENIMLCGNGLFDGSYTDEDGYTAYALYGGDPPFNEYRERPGHNGAWFGNKGIALVDCKNVVLKDFSIVCAGHFAIICEGVENMLVDSILADTIRDALDIDCCRDVTVVHSRFNSLTDDALVMKASYGAGKYMPIYNVYIEDCDVTGYDAGSVYAKKYTCDKLVATDRCGPTARVKLGTESTCGYELVTVKNVRFKRSRGFALEAVDTSDLTDIVFTDCVMENVSSSPIYIRIGDRGRFPVTGNSGEELVYARDNVRLDNTQWVLPDTPDYGHYPAARYVPSYNYSKKVTVDGHSYFNIVDEDNPVRLNPANYYERDGHYYEYRYNDDMKKYEPDFSREICKDRLCLYANAVGNASIAAIKNIEISNITVKDADPRYPIIIMGVDSRHIENVSLKNIDVEYRGGLTMEHAVEQRQLSTNWKYSQLGSRPSVQLIPWLVNTFFLKNEGLLPRMSWDAGKKCFVPSPYNVPELANVYPEPSNWGILPAYGLYARHIDGLILEDVRLHYIVKEERPAVVFDDVHRADVGVCDFMTEADVPQIVLVDNNYKRPTNFEYVPDYPYHSTDNSVTFSRGADGREYDVERVRVDSPAPGTPRDSLYGYPTSATAENGYSYGKDTDEYELPRTVYRPYFIPVGDITVKKGESVCFEVKVRNPYTDGTEEAFDTSIWNEGVADKEHTVRCGQGKLELNADNIPTGADFDHFDAGTGKFSWIPEKAGQYNITFAADDGVIPVHMTVHIYVEEE